MCFSLISFKPKSGGGISLNSTIPLTYIDEKMVRNILHEYKIHHAEILFRCDATVDEFIDIVEGNRSYMKCIYVYNKVDQLSMEEVEEIAKKPHSIPVSLSLNLNLDNLVKMMWEYLALVRVYTKRRGGRTRNI